MAIELIDEKRVLQILAKLSRHAASIDSEESRQLVERIDAMKQAMTSLKMCQVTLDTAIEKFGLSMTEQEGATQ